MNAVEERTRSLWMSELPRPALALTANLQTDVVVVGAGVGGLTTAYMLAKAGKKVVVIDAGVPGGGMTARTSAHITTLLDDHWSKLIKDRGEDKARRAAEAQSRAIDMIEAIQRDENIACDFARVDGYLVLGDEGTETLLKRERTAAHAVELEASFEEQAPHKSFSGACLRFPHQGRFHPLKYLKGLIACIERDGGKIVCGRVTEVKGGRAARVEVEGGFEIKTKAVVVATNFPINDKRLIKKQTVYRSYVIAGAVPKGVVPDALIFDTEWPYHYVRLQPNGGHDVLLVGGEDHKTGKALDMEERFERLEKWARKHFPEMERVTWRWSGQVMQSGDSLAFLGALPGKDKNVYVIAGDSGQGIVNGTIGAMMITDAIQKRANPWVDVFNPSRRPGEPTHSEPLPKMRPKQVHHIDDIPLGGGAVLVRGNEKIAVYRSKDDEFIERCAKCPHMGCPVAWNPAEECWDCHCHGSQFSPDGKVLHGPATSDLAPLPEERRDTTSEQPPLRT